MKHEKTFEAINKLKDIELELNRLKNALEMANKALDTKRTWVEIDDDEAIKLIENDSIGRGELFDIVTAKLKQKNGYDT